MEESKETYLIKCFEFTMNSNASLKKNKYIYITKVVIFVFSTSTLLKSVFSFKESVFFLKNYFYIKRFL